VEHRELEIRIDPDLAEGSVGDLAGLSLEEAARTHPADFAHGHSVVARLAASGRTAPGGEPLSVFVARAARAARRVRDELAAGGGVLVVSHGGLLNYLLQLLLEMEPRESVPFGFDHCGALRLLAYREPPGFGPFPMLRFGPPLLDPADAAHDA